MVTATSLQNFGVPTGSSPTRGGILMPKIKNRFRVLMTSFGATPSPFALTQQVITCGRPNVNFNPQTLHSYNSTAYYAGKAEWETVTLTVRDDMTNSVSTLISKQIQLQMDFFNQTVLPVAMDYKFEMKVDALDGGDDITLEEWLFEGCFLATVNYETYDYSSADAMTIEMTVRFDNALITAGPRPVNSFATGGAYTAHV